ncbi:RNA-binding domain-containing protein [Trichodelitschia bisporula]|uniref:RNA-binding domain-containing protein n=1 Tax=Trichodelitschia bisporula TaxID=703511 RepID=A0A6G1HUG9_9PEZI|nr:RNA-binding domain-containing protein [Trichodelitschia bisporula]
MSAMDFDAEPRGYDAGDDHRDYDRDGRDRSRSPRRDRRDDSDMRQRSASPSRSHQDHRGGNRGDLEEGAENPGSNLFVTGIASRVSEQELSGLFEKHGEVQNCHIMRDPHSGDSRGFGFVKYALVEQADACIAELHGQNYEGRTLSIEKARRNRPRTPTPGKYHGPPKKDDFPVRRGGGRDRFDDRRGYGGRRDDYYGGGGGSRGSRYGDRYDDRDRGYGRRYRERDDYNSSGGGYGGSSSRIDRYAGGRDNREPREDRYGGGGGRDEPRGGGGGGGYGGGSYPREDRAAASYSGGADAAPREGREAYTGGGGGSGSGGRTYDDRGDDRYSRR